MERTGKTIQEGENINKSREALDYAAAEDVWRGEAGKMDWEDASCYDSDSISSCHRRMGHNTSEAKKWNLCPRLFQKTFTHK